MIVKFTKLGVRRQDWKELVQYLCSRSLTSTSINHRQQNRDNNFLTAPLPELSDFGDRGKNIKSYGDLYKFSIEEGDKFWGTLANSRLQWYEKFKKVREGDFPEKVRWFPGGKLNATVNCVDRHSIATPDKIALIHESDEPHQTTFVTYAELDLLVRKYAHILRKVGHVRKGDRVAIYLPTSPRAVAMALACARIGAIHTIIFAGFSAEAVASRISDCAASVVVTADAFKRGGKLVELKKIVDHALDHLEHSPTVKTVLVQGRDEGSWEGVRMKHPRDHFLQDLMAGLEDGDLNDHAEVMDSNDPLFILYTSGSTGKPKGIVHSTAGYLLYANVTFQNVFDYREGDIFGCVADVGWITGHSYIMYAPLSCGGTTLLFESIPTYPDPSRYWEMAQRLRLTHLYAAPTAIKLLMRLGPSWLEKYDRSSLRILGTVGELINKEGWQWFHDVAGQGRCDVVDTWWQTETGGILLAPRPSGVGDPLLPAMPMRPFYGVKPQLKNAVVNDDGDQQGDLCIEQPWPGLALGIWGDVESKRFKELYFKEHSPSYFSADGGILSKEGYWRITGRLDDVINVTGHRLGTGEVEDAIHEHQAVAEVACVGFPHEMKGEALFAFVVLKAGVNKQHKEIEKEIKQLVKASIAGYAVPDFILITDGLPKTRSGKVMRRILRKIASGKVDDLGDTSTLTDPHVVDELVKERNKLVGTS